MIARYALIIYVSLSVVESRRVGTCASDPAAEHQKILMLDLCDWPFCSCRTKIGSPVTPARTYEIMSVTVQRPFIKQEYKDTTHYLNIGNYRTDVFYALTAVS